MFRLSVRYIFVFATLLLIANTTHAQLLQEKYSTSSESCAVAIEDAIAQMQSGDLQGSLRTLANARRFDPNCVFVPYWEAQAFVELGQQENAVRAWKEAVELSWATVQDEDWPLATADSALLVGIAASKDGYMDDGAFWLSRAVGFDLFNRHDIQAMAYRNLAINAASQGLYFLATLRAMKSVSLPRSKTEPSMARNFATQAGFSEKFAAYRPVEDVICAALMYDLAPNDSVVMLKSYSGKPIKLPNPPGNDPVYTRDEMLESQFNEAFRAAAAVPANGGVYILSRKEPYVVFFDSDTNSIGAISYPFPVSAVATGQEHLYLARSGSSAIDVVGFYGQIVDTISIPQPTRSIAVDEGANELFAVVDGKVLAVHTKTHQQRASIIPADRVVVDPSRRRLFSTIGPANSFAGHTSGTILIRGRPIFFNIIDTNSVFSEQDVLMESIYDPFGNLVLASARGQAASNAFSLSISGDGHWISVTGGGGYRPKSGPGGYGTAVFSSRILKKVESFYPVDAYSKASIFDPRGEQFALVGTKMIRVFNLGRPGKYDEHPGEYSGVASWTEDGEYLIAGLDKGGIHAYRRQVPSDPAP